MGDHEFQSVFKTTSEVEILDGHHFYAAYVFDRANERKKDIQALVEAAQRLGYPVRYWWLSESMDLQGAPDRLIVCVHHPSRSENAGMDLYDVLKDKEVTWDELEAAVVEEYCDFGKPVGSLEDLRWPDGDSLFAQADQGQEYSPKSDGVFFQITVNDVREEAEELLNRKLSDEEIATLMSYFRKALEYLDWRPHLKEAIQWCEISGLIKPGEDEHQSED